MDCAWRISSTRTILLESDLADGAAEEAGAGIEPDGDSYEGEWAEGNKHGKGKETSASGDSYEGEYVEDEKHGSEVWDEDKFKAAVGL